MGAGFIALVVAFVLYACAFIYRTSFEVGGVRYFCLFDDAMISMRFAKNLANGIGLVWNPGGERVEGFSNPLWVLYMSLFHLLPIPPSKISLFVQLSGAACLLLTLIYIRRISHLLAPGSRTAEYSSVALTAFYVPLVNWSLQGMEVGVLALMVTICVWMALRAVEKGQVGLPMYIVLGLMTLVRMDTAGLVVVLLACLMVVDPGNRRKHFLVGGSILSLSLGMQTVLRHIYFGENLPNTYFLKMTGLSLLHRLQRGGGALLDFASGMTWIVFLFPFAGLLLRRDWRFSLLAILFLTQCVYSVYVGGDAWEWWGGSNRYIAITMPLFFVLFGCTLAKLKSAWEKLRIHESLLTPLASRTLVWVLLLLSYFQLNNVVGGVRMSDWMDGGKFLASTAIGGHPDVGMREVSEVVSWLLIPSPLELFENMRMVRASALLDSITAPGARVVVTLAGTLPYFSSRTFIDLLGKNDKTIARMEARPTIDPNGKLNYTPGHSKWAYSYSIGFLKPDVVFQLWAAADEAQPFLDADYRAVRLENRTWYFRRGSTEIRWETLQRLAAAETSPGQ